MFSYQENNLINLLRATKEVLDKHNIKFWLDAGTVLGFKRNGKFIPWDHDIDLGIWYEKIPKETVMLVFKELCNKGFGVRINESYMNILKKEGFWIDLNFYRLTDNKAIIPLLYPKNFAGRYLSILLLLLSSSRQYLNIFNYSRTKSSIKCFIYKIIINICLIIPPFFKKPVIYIVSFIYKKIGAKNITPITPSKYFKNLSTIKFYGMELNAPAEIEEYLVSKYGKDWRIPRSLNNGWIHVYDELVKEK